jgi:hypothetical protein
MMTAFDLECDWGDSDDAALMAQIVRWYLANVKAPVPEGNFARFKDR